MYHDTDISDVLVQRKRHDMLVLESFLPASSLEKGLAGKCVSAC